MKCTATFLIFLRTLSSVKNIDRHEKPRNRPKFPPAADKKLVMSYTKLSECSSVKRVSYSNLSEVYESDELSGKYIDIDFLWKYLMFAV
jgi:hypothetical protein